MRIYFVIALIFSSFFASAQVAEVRTYGGIHHDEFNDIVETTEGYVMIGSTSSPDNGNSDVYAVHVNFDLEFQWSALFGGPGAEVGKEVLVDSNGDIYLVGYTSFGTNGGYDGYVAKIAPDGALIWELNVGSTDWDTLEAAVIWNNTIWAGGTSFNSDSGLSNQYFVEIDSDGTLVQETITQSTNTERVEAMMIFNDELLVSFTREHELTSDAGIYSLNSGFTQLWNHEKVGDESNSYRASHLDANEMNNIAWVITSFQTLDFEDEMIQSRFENDGTFIGEFAVESTGNQLARSTIWSGDAAMNVANTNVFGAGGNGIYMERRINNGIWTAGVVFGGENDEDPRKIIEDSEGRLLVVGTSTSYSDFTVDAYLLRIPDNFLINDYVLDLEESYDSFLTSVDESQEIEVLVYPNPTSGAFHISGIDGQFDFSIYNTSGQLVKKGTSEQEEWLLNQPPGVYFIQVETSEAIRHFQLQLLP